MDWRTTLFALALKIEMADNYGKKMTMDVAFVSHHNSTIRFVNEYAAKQVRRNVFFVSLARCHLSSFISSRYDATWGWHLRMTNPSHQ